MRLNSSFFSTLNALGVCLLICGYFLICGCSRKIADQSIKLARDLRCSDLRLTKLSAPTIFSICTETEALFSIESLGYFSGFRDNELHEQIMFRAAEVATILKAKGISPLSYRLSGALVAATRKHDLVFSDHLVNKHYGALIEYLGAPDTSVAGAIPNHADIIAWDSLFLYNTLSQEVTRLFSDPTNAPAELIRDKRYLRLMVLSAMVSRSVSVSIALKSIKDHGLAPEEEYGFDMVMQWSRKLDEYFGNMHEVNGSELMYLIRSVGERYGHRSVGSIIGNLNVLSRYSTRGSGSGTENGVSNTTQESKPDAVNGTEGEKTGD